MTSRNENRLIPVADSSALQSEMLRYLTPKGVALIERAAAIVEQSVAEFVCVAALDWVTTHLSNNEKAAQQ